MGTRLVGGYLIQDQKRVCPACFAAIQQEQKPPRNKKIKKKPDKRN
jgi:hypothetical protein